MEHVNGRAHGPASGTTTPRLLPWPSPEGKPCYLVTDNDGGCLSRLADDLEATQLAIGTEVLGLARTVLDDPTSPYTEVRYSGLRLAECLRDALRVAESRGLRLPAPGSESAVDVVRLVEEEQSERGHGQAARNARSGLWS